MESPPPSPPPARVRRPWRRLLLIFLLQAGFLVAIVLVVARNPPPAWWIPGDGVDLPGAASAASVRVVLPDPRRGTRGVRGLAVEFFAVAEGGAETPLGSAVTDRDGRASVPWTMPESPGLVGFVARASAPDASGSRREVAGVRAVAPADRPLVLVLVRGALRSLQVPLTGAGRERLAVREGAPDALASLAAEATIVYVATHGARSPEELRVILGAEGLPAGPLLYFPAATEPEDLREALAAIALEPWKAKTWGVCARLDEARAFHGAGLRAVVLAPDSNAALPNVVAVSNWERVPEAIRKRR